MTRKTIVVRSILGSPPNSMGFRILGSTVIHHMVSEANCPAMTFKPGDMSVEAANHGEFCAQSNSSLAESSALIPAEFTPSRGN